MNKQTALYRHFDADGALLYVGIACNVTARQYWHIKKQHWGDKIATITVERFPDRQSALNAEAIAIKQEEPIFNIQGASRSKNNEVIASDFKLSSKQEAKLSKMYFRGTEFNCFIASTASDMTGKPVTIAMIEKRFGRRPTLNTRRKSS